MGLITDTMEDDRWVTLPGQPYQVRSVLCLPIFKGHKLIALLTLMHSEPEHFSSENCQSREMFSTQLGLIIDHILLYSGEEFGVEKTEEKSPEVHVNEKPQNQGFQVGTFIIDEHGNFLYANRRLAEIFGYEFGELVSFRINIFFSGYRST